MQEHIKKYILKEKHIQKGKLSVMIHPNYFSPPLAPRHLQAPLSYQNHQYLSLFSHYPSSLQPHQGHLCKWIWPMFHYHLRQREPQMTNYGYPQMPQPSTSHHLSFICNLLDSNTTVKLLEESPSAQSTAHYTSPSQPCSMYLFPLMLILDPPPLWMPSAKANHVTHPRNPVSSQPDHSCQKLKSPTTALLKEGMLQTISVMIKALIFRFPLPYPSHLTCHQYPSHLTCTLTCLPQFTHRPNSSHRMYPFPHCHPCL